MTDDSSRAEARLQESATTGHSLTSFNRFFMPYLQLDVTRSYSLGDKKRLAAAMSETYARMMSVDIRRISVAIRELGEGGVWRIPEMGDEPTPVSMLMLDIRRGRPAGLRMQVAKALCQHCVDILGLQENRLNVEFTQHDGDEMYHRRLAVTAQTGSPARRETALRA